MSNDRFYNLCINNDNYNIYKDFKTFDKDVIYSLYKEIFDPVGNKSINAINNYDPFLSGVKISKELNDILFTDNDYDMLTYIFTTYLKLCKIFSFITIW